MNNWMDEAARLLKARAPLLTDKHASELAGDLYSSWPDDTPTLALTKFFRDTPIDWKRPVELAEAA
jgi:hypothetical protein